MDLIFWVNKNIYFYNLSDKNYVKYQEIDESIQDFQEKETYSWYDGRKIGIRKKKDKEKKK